MEFWQNALRILDVRMETPSLFGWFHLLWLGITIAASLGLWLWHRKRGTTPVRKVVLGVAVAVVLLEIYKQINFSFSYADGITFDFQWYAFPFQFCSTPMYVGLLAGLSRPGKLHDAACAYLATFSVFAGVCVMIYPRDVFVPQIGINIQTMICHSSMIVVGVYLLCSGHVKLEHRTVLRAIPVFAVAVALACVMNELAYRTGLLETETFNMFFVSPHCEPSLPVYSLVQQVVPFPVSLLIYVGIFTLAAWLILLLAMAIRQITAKHSIPR